MFLHLSVILFTGGVSARHHPLADTPWTDTPGRHPPQVDTPWAETPPRSRHPLGRNPPKQTPLSMQTPPRPPLQRTVRILLECILVP